MAGNRALFEKIILTSIARITSHKENVQFYVDKFKAMSDKDIDGFCNDLAEGKVALSIVEPNYSGKALVPNEEIMKVAEEFGFKFLQKLWVEGKDGSPSYLTPVAYPILLVPARRASQALIKKISVPPHTRVRDLLTGQVTGESKGATVSGPENQLLGAMGAIESAIEMNKYRAGDARGEAALVALLSRTGRASQQVLSQFASGVQVNSSLRTFLTAAMHRVNL